MIIPIVFVVWASASISAVILLENRPRVTRYEVNGAGLLPMWQLRKITRKVQEYDKKGVHR